MKDIGRDMRSKEVRMYESKKQYTNKLVLPNFSSLYLACVPLTMHFLLNWCTTRLNYSHYSSNAVIMRDKCVVDILFIIGTWVRGVYSYGERVPGYAVGEVRRVGRAPKGSPPQGRLYIVTTSPTKFIPKLLFLEAK